MGCCCAKQYNAPKAVSTKWFNDFFKTLPSMAGKVVVVTGCTTGTGLVHAITCAKLGATVVMLNRASERATAAEKQVKAEAPDDSKVVSIPCDLTSFASVRSAAEAVRKQCEDQGIDVLCNNAGVMALKDEATKDGYDVQMQTNYLSHFLLTSELWPLLTKAGELRGEARVVNHSSIACYGPKVQEKYLGKNGGNLGGDKLGCCLPMTGPRWDRYHQTKLANVVFTYALQEKADAINSKVKALVAHPGVAATNLQVTTTADKGMSAAGANMFVSQSAEDGAMGIILCSCQKDVVKGGFYGPPGKMGMKGQAVLNKEVKEADKASREMLWKASTVATGPFEPQ